MFALDIHWACDQSLQLVMGFGEQERSGKIICASAAAAT